MAISERVRLPLHLAYDEPSMSHEYRMSGGRRSFGYIRVRSDSIIKLTSKELTMTSFVWITIFAFLTCAGCGCANKVVGTVKAPRGFLQAIIFTRDCGATTSFSTHISIVGLMNSEPWGGGDVFIADHDHGKVGLSSQNQLSVDMKWVNATTLLIVYPQHARIFKREAKVRGVSVEYQTRD